MPFIIPDELFSISGSIPLSQYKNVDESSYFILQKRKSSGLYALQLGDEPLYRVIIQTEDLAYMIAYENDWKSIQSCEWRYILVNFAELLPKTLTPELRNKWILAHFTQLAVETANKSSGSSLGHNRSSSQQNLSPLSLPSSPNLASVQRLELPQLEQKEGTPVIPSTPTSTGSATDEEEHMSAQLHQQEVQRSIKKKMKSKLKKKQPTSFTMDLSGLRVAVVTVAFMNLFLVLLRDVSPTVFTLTQIFLSIAVCCVVIGKDPVGVKLQFTLKTNLPSVQFASQDDGTDASWTTSKKTKKGVRGLEATFDSKKTSKTYIDGQDLAYRAQLSRPRQQSTREDSWADTNSRSFNVRHGPNYRWSKIKDKSGDALYHLVGIDIFKYNSKFETTHLASKIDTTRYYSPRPASELQTPADSMDAPELFLINFLLPIYSPSMISKREDGEGRTLAIYFALKDATREAIVNNSGTPSISLLRRFMHACRTEGKLRARLKCIPRVANIQELSLGFSLKSLLEQYTKPFLTGPLYHDFYSGKGYVECDIDIHRYCYWARKVAFDVIQWLPEAIIELAFVVEAQGDEEMPEQVIGSVRLNKLHPDDDAMDASEWLASALHQTTGKESGDASTEQAANKPPLSGQTAFSKRRSSSDMVHTANDVTREGLHQRRQSHSAL